MKDTEKSPEELLDMFGDDLVRRILLLTSDTPMSADALANELDVSRPTVYRRVNALAECALLREDLETDSDGHHYRTFEPALNEITFEFDDGVFGVTVEMDADLVDKFDGFLGGLDDSYSGTGIGTSEQSETSHTRSDLHYG